MPLIIKIFVKPFLLTFLLGLAIAACSNAKNYNEAYKIEANGKKYLKLYGERNYMAHDPSSVSSNDTYKDSLLIEVPSFEDGIISGASIPVKAGKYSYLGEMVIESELLEVNLQINDTNERKLRQLSWNGSYTIKESKE